MRKIHPLWKTRGMAAMVALGGLVLLASCAEGFDDDETFSSDVKNTQLTSPELTKDCFSIVTKSDGSEQVQVAWKVVQGAGGYKCTVTDVTNTASPEVIVDSVVADGLSFMFKRVEDRNYTVAVQALGNTAYNNTDAETASSYAYSTFVAGSVIPAGSDIVEFVKNNIVDTDDEQAFELEAGASYRLDAPLDFGKYQVTFRGNKYNRPTVTLGTDGVIRNSNGLKLKFINFDCTEQKAKGGDGATGVVEMSAEPDDAFTASNFVSSNTQKMYMCVNPIIIQECMFKNVHGCLFALGNCSWGIKDVRVNDCIVQIDNDGTNWGNGAVICGYSTNHSYQGTTGACWYSSILNITLSNSTFYNIQKNSKNYFFRFSNKDINKVFGTKYGTLSMTDCTFSKTMTGKDFANNMPEVSEYALTMQNCVFYDTWRLQKLDKRNTFNRDGLKMETNTIWGVTNSVDNTDKTVYAVEEDPGFGDITQELDLTQPNGGVSFKATGAVSSGVGDPRWLE